MEKPLDTNHSMSSEMDVPTELDAQTENTTTENVPISNASMTTVPTENVPTENVPIETPPQTNNFNNSPMNAEEDTINPNEEPDMSPTNETSFKNDTVHDEMDTVVQTKAETVYMKDQNIDVTPIVMRVVPHKGHHFTLRNDDASALTEIMEEMGYTVEFPTENNSPDLLVSKEGNIVCKVHFLLCDKKDVGTIRGKKIDRTKMNLYYINLYFFAGFDPMIKDVIVEFFKELSRKSFKKSSRRRSSKKKTPTKLSRRHSSRRHSSRRHSSRRHSSTKSSRSPSHKKYSSSDKYMLRALSHITSSKTKRSKKRSTKHSTKHKGKKHWHTKRHQHKKRRHTKRYAKRHTKRRKHTQHRTYRR
jgi:hypothetical protein